MVVTDLNGLIDLSRPTDLNGRMDEWEDGIKGGRTTSLP